METRSRAGIPAMVARKRGERRRHRLPRRRAPVEEATSAAEYAASQSAAVTLAAAHIGGGQAKRVRITMVSRARWPPRRTAPRLPHGRARRPVVSHSLGGRGHSVPVLGRGSDIQGLRSRCKRGKWATRSSCRSAAHRGGGKYEEEGFFSRRRKQRAGRETNHATRRAGPDMRHADRSSSRCLHGQFLQCRSPHHMRLFLLRPERR